MARTLVASDNFNRADSGSLGANWSDLFPGWATVDIGTNTAVAADVSNPQVARWNGAGTFSDDQYAKAVVSTRVWQSSSYRTGVLVRASADIDSARDYYFLVFYHDQDVGSAVTTVLGKCLNGTESTLVTDTTIAWAVSDTIELEVTTVGGNAQLRAFRNGSVVTALNHTDSTSPFTTGKPGIYLQGNSSIAADDWEGGSVSSTVDVALSGSAATPNAGAVTPSQSAPASGSAATSAVGSVVFALTVALAGAAITASQGVASPNNDGVVPLTGSETTSAQQTISPSWGQALTGAESTSAQETLTFTLRPTDITGQAITPGAGTVSASSNSVTVNISGSEVVFEAGTVTGGTQAVSGQAVTSAQGSSTQTLELPISGMEMTSQIGNVSTGQEADDTYIALSLGNAAPAMSLALTGAESTAGTGTLTVTGDAFVELTGEVSTSSTGTLEYNKQEPITGSEIVSAQSSMGAPGGANLSGQAVSVVAGDVFTTNDREFAITGIEITSASGATFASPLAFVDGLEIVSSAQEIGPRGADLVGIEISTAAGDITVPRASHRGAAATDKPSNKGRRNYTYKGKRYYQLTNDELAKLIARDLIDLSREDIQVTYKNKKPHKIGKETFDTLVDTASKMPKQEINDDQDIEDIIALL
jgi:hypothetical protein